jgi:ribonuclease VapC
VITADTSALVAIVLGEADAERYLTSMRDEAVILSAVSQVEAASGPWRASTTIAARDLQLLLDATVAELVAVDVAHARAATAAWRRFGRGRHPAALNFGDCFAYATARLAGTPLLFKGEDFSRTDIGSVL